MALARALAMIGAALGLAALALQYALLTQTLGSAGLAAWRFVGFFTLLSNMLAVAVWLSRPGPRLELATATAIAMVGLVYTALLRATWNPRGWQKLADSLLHDVTPLLFVAYFLMRPRRRLGAADALCALIFPLAYVLYAMARGAADGWYAYWFLDPRRLSLPQMALSVAGLALAFAAMAAALAWVSNRLNRGGLS
jgi:hypothetical protein